MTDEALFAAALDAPDRAAALAACPTRSSAAASERLLAAHDKASGFLNHPPVAGETRTFAGSVVSDDDADDAVGFLSPPTRADSLGRLGHYEVLEILGRGGFGIVFRAFDDTLQRVVAVKVLSPAMAATSPARKRFLREARTSAAGATRERGFRSTTVGEHPAAVPGDGVHPRRDAPAAPRPHRPAGPCRKWCGSAGRLAEGLAAAHAAGA